MASLGALVAEIYSVSVVDGAMILCNQEHHETVPLVSENKYPVKDPHQVGLNHIQASSNKYPV